MLRFPPFTLDLITFELCKNGQPLTLRPKVYDVLVYLIKHRDRVVSKYELMDHVWPNQFITETNLITCIKELRQVLEDRGNEQRIIQTLRRRGFRFMAEVVNVSDGSEVVPGLASVSEGVVAGQRGSGEPSGSLATISSVEWPAVAGAANKENRGGLGETVTGSSERKRVTVLWCTLANGGQLFREVRGAEQQVLMERFSGLVKHTVYHYGGTFYGFIEEEALSLFGAPQGQEDRSRRAALAALGLMHRAREAVNLEHGLYQGEEGADGWRLAIMLLEGEVEVHRIVGGDGHVTLRLTPSSVDHLQAMRAQAQAEAILLSEGIGDALGEEVEAEAIERSHRGGNRTAEDLVLKSGGRAGEGQRLYRLIRVGPRRASLAYSRGEFLSHFVGRERDVEYLGEVFEQVKRGRGQVIGIVGEPGMGKSRLLYEFAQRLGEAEVFYVQGRCVSYGQTSPYLVVVDTLKRIFGFTEEESSESIEQKLIERLTAIDCYSEEHVALLLHLLDLPSSSPALANHSATEIKQGTFMLLHELFLRHSQQQPVILEIEDLHWIDATSQEWLEGLVVQMSASRLQVVLSYRPGFHPPWMDKSYASQRALQPLSHEASLQILREVIGDTPVSESKLEAFAHKGEGNPFFLEELGQSLLDQGRLTEEQGAQSVSTVPRTVHEVILARIDRVSPEAKQLLQVASVIGREAPLGLLERLLHRPGIWIKEQVLSLQEHEFMYEGRIGGEEAMVIFKHALTQEAVYASLVSSHRQKLHQAIAEQMVEHFPHLIAARPERVAHHYVAADLAVESIPYWLQAGRQAVEHSAHHEAIEHLQRGLAILKQQAASKERDQQELDFYIVLSSALAVNRGYASPELNEAIHRIQELSQNVGEIYPLVSELTFFLVGGQLQKVLDTAEKLLAYSDCHQNDLIKIPIHIVMGMALFHQGHFSAAATLLENGINHYAPQKGHLITIFSGQDARISGLSYIAHCQWLQGFPEKSRKTTRQLSEQTRTVEHPCSIALSYFHIALNYSFYRMVDNAIAQANATISLSNLFGFPYWNAGGTIINGWALASHNDFQQGVLLIEEGIAAWQSTGAEMGLPHFYSLLAQAHLLQEDTKRGLQAITQGQYYVRKNGEESFASELIRLKGELLIMKANAAAGDERHRLVEQAETCFMEALKIAKSQGAKSLELRAAMSWYQHFPTNKTAQVTLRTIYDSFTEGWDTHDLKEARRLLL